MTFFDFGELAKRNNLITSSSSDENFFIGHGNMIFLGFNYGKREHVLSYERGFGKRSQRKEWNEYLHISYSKLDYTFYFSNIGASNKKLGGAFGLTSSVIVGNIARKWSTQPSVYQGIESNFIDYGLGFNVLYSYGFKNFNLFLNTNTNLYLKNITPSFNMIFGIVYLVRSQGLTNR